MPPPVASRTLPTGSFVRVSSMTETCESFRAFAQRRAWPAASALTSVIAMWDAPEKRAISAHIAPIGP